MSNPNPAYKFPKGVSGNPGGKPVNSRNSLQKKFLFELARDFDEHGKQAIIDMREKSPGDYIKAVVALMPKEIDITRPMDDISDEQLEAALIAARAIIAAQDSGTREELPTVNQPAEVV